jgi:hypothetical protein
MKYQPTRDQANTAGGRKTRPLPWRLRYLLVQRRRPR